MARRLVDGSQTGCPDAHQVPRLSIVGGIAIAFAIAAGAGTFEFLTQLVHPTLPLYDGDRIVGIRLWHTACVFRPIVNAHSG
jgi:hypothetical protein